MSDNRRLISLIILPALIGFLFLCACQREERKWRIGVAQCSDDLWRRQMNDEIERELLFHDNASVEIRSANDSNSRQIDDLHYFADSGFDIIVVAPNEAEALAPTIREIYRKGIPVVVFDRAIPDTTYTAYIELDNAGIGRNAALYAANHLRHKGGTGRVLEITGLPGSTPAEERHRGFAEVIDSIGNIPVAGSFHGDWRAESARAITDSVLRTNPDISVIYAHNDVMAISAAEAARSLGRGDIFVIGTDAAPALGIRAVADSLIDATFIYPTMGDMVISTAIDILEGRKVPRVRHIPSQDYIDRSNAPFHLRQEELLRDKTARIELLNDKYSLIKDHHSQQRVLLFTVLSALILLTAGIIGLLYFLRQKNRLQGALMDKNRQLMEGSTRQAELYSRLEEATREKLVFFTNVSHDLLTPLTLIADPIDMLEQEEMSARGKTLVGMMRRNIDILRRMIRQILDFRKYQNGKESVSLEETDVESLVRERGEMFLHMASGKGIDYAVETTATGETMAVDVDKLERILFNLVMNAIKYTPANGKIRVAASMDGEVFRLEVRNSGKGISAEETGRIFERYYRIAESPLSGVGIGLALTKAFVEMMEGEITVESKEGEGACFKVSLPVRHVEQKETDDNREVSVSSEAHSPLTSEAVDKGIQGESRESVRADGADSGRPLMLVIDDNPDIRRLIRMMCEGDYEIIEASDGKEGVRKAIRYVPDVIICDIMMPGMDGLEATMRLKEERATSHIPVLILTASRLDEQRVRSYVSGADGFLSKPFTEEMLKARCHNLILNRRRIFDLFMEAPASPIEKKEREDTRNAADISVDNDFYRDFLFLVKDRLGDENLSVKDIAGRLGIGPAQLTRKIRALTGTTPVDIIRRLRLREGRNLLLSTDRPVADIAYSLGFSSPQYFARCFREEFGAAPTDLRNTVR